MWRKQVEPGRAEGMFSLWAPGVCKNKLSNYGFIARQTTELYPFSDHISNQEMHLASAAGRPISRMASLKWPPISSRSVGPRWSDTHNRLPAVIRPGPAGDRRHVQPADRTERDVCPLDAVPG
ncbi:hypothetical protein EYF80_022141 [Liparis tanakae]|uniref:Uncharacterized protein n=1 Tax=Liparis tanakae TaxID=230148 RepID=A0A4Z2HPH5_9TELE|nr:hypothetical protein EYF80_022141 [Liparis tanakae]